jgi:aminoglycoside phosphotransferase (APT) family kinase protein
MIDVLETIVGAPLELEELKYKPGRRRTLRARGPRSSAIVKLYGSPRASVVARRAEALAAGPPEPVTPAVLHVDSKQRFVVLSDVPGPPLREALLDGDLATCSRIGAALAAWHAAWEGAVPDAVQPHTIARELEILRTRAEAAAPPVAREVFGALARLSDDWACSTVVHRDLYEEQVLAGERVGLIDVDDAALGPPELDLGNLLAHVELLERRTQSDLGAPRDAVLRGYGENSLDESLLDRCRRLSRLRLACIHGARELAA